MAPSSDNSPSRSAPRALRADLLGGGEGPYRHRQIEDRAFLLNVGGSEVDGDLAGGQFAIRVSDRRPDAFLGFLHRRVRQPHDGKRRQASADVDFDVDRIRVQPQDRRRAHLRQHG